MLGDLVAEIIHSDISLSVDTAYVYIVCSIENDLLHFPKRRQPLQSNELENRITQTKIWVDKFINRITSDEMIKKMPREIRAIAGFTKIHAEKYCSKNISAFIGGFVMLRYIAPGIVTPESFGISDGVPSIESRANLVIIAKILQNISNRIRFEDSKKEYHMHVFDEFVMSRFDRMSQYFKIVADDPKHDHHRSPWRDFLIPVIGSEDDIPLEKIGIQELFTLHRLFDRFKDKICSEMKDNMEFLKLVFEMGPPPSASIQSVIKSSLNQHVETAENFFYQGKPNKKGLPVFYLIVCRMDLTLFDNVHELTKHIFDNITQAVGPSQEISIVIDMSWSSRDELRKKFFKNTTELTKIASMIQRSDKKRVKEIHLVHPMNISKVILLLLKTTVKTKSYSKIFEHEKWKTLSKYIDLDKISLPDETKSFIAKAYRVIKINAKGKRQNRVVKFTSNSILNIDPKTKSLKNEKLLTDIESISLNQEGVIVLNFSSESIERDSGKKKGMFNVISLSNKADLETRKYICANKAESEKFMEDIFEAAFHATKLRYPQQFKVIKVNGVGKHQERIFKFTCDSLLNMDGHRIRTEISYAGIKDVKVDKHDVHTLYIQLKSETTSRRIICKTEGDRNDLYYTLARKVLEAQGEMNIEEAELRHGSTELYRMTIDTIGVYK